MDLPARIGKYELQEFLGGGMSHVYRARDTLIGRTVAVKILTDAGCQDTEVKEHFLAEARMAGSLAHDNVLGIYESPPMKTASSTPSDTALDPITNCSNWYQTIS
jgi:serine/threonine-protein kinase